MIQGKAKISNVFRILIIAAMIYMLGYIRAFFGVSASFVAYYKYGIVLLGVILAIWSYTKKAKNAELAKCYNLLTRYMKIYLPIIVFMMIYSFIIHDYSIRMLFLTSLPYLYVFWAYPICYVLFKDGTSEKMLNTILLLVVGILIIKFIGWFLFQYGGIKVFEDLIFQYKDWARSETHRVDIGYLFAFAYTFALLGMFRKKVKIKYIAIVIGMIVFTVIVTQYRYLVITILIEFLIVYYLSSKDSKNRVLRVLLIAIVLAAFILFGGLDFIINSFSVQGEYGTSTMARVKTITHYWGEVTDKFRIFGLGFLSESDPITGKIGINVTRGTYWMSDIGILGGFFTFGILSIPLYFYLFYLAITTCKKAYRFNNRKKLIMSVGLSTYLIVLCIMMNIFDEQRSFNLPFYLAFFSFWNYRINKDGFGSSRI